MKKPKLPKPNLFGYHAVREAWLNPERNISALFLTPQAAKGFESDLHSARKQGLKRPDPAQIDKKDLDYLLPRGAVHQGIAMKCAPLPKLFLQDLTIKSESQDRSLVLVLDQVTDPHNVGAIIRSACAFGVSGIIMQSKHAPELNGHLAKAACGAVEHVPVIYETNLSRALDNLKQEGFFAYGLDERGKQTVSELATNDPPNKLALVLGAEGPGIRKLVKEHCDELIRLPMSGPIPSLNVSNAAAVALFALADH